MLLLENSLDVVLFSTSILASIPLQQQIQDNDNDGIDAKIDVENKTKSREFSNSNKTTFGSVIDYGNQTINIRQADANGIMIISKSSTGEYPALINVCNQYEYYIETNDEVRIDCHSSNSQSTTKEGANIE